MRRSLLREFLRLEAAGGFLLIGAAALALIVANSPLAWLYDGLLDTPVAVLVGALKIAKPLLLVDQRRADGDLLPAGRAGDQARGAERRAVEPGAAPALPVVAAVGGMAVPAAIYLAVNAGNPARCAAGRSRPPPTSPSRSASCPCSVRACRRAEDFPAGARDHRRSRRDRHHRALLHRELSLLALLLGGAGVLALADPEPPRRARRLAPYLLIGVALWVCVLKSGVHATLAGVAAALADPDRRGEDAEPPLRHLEHALHPWVAYAIMPIFAFANAGVSFAEAVARRSAQHRCRWASRSASSSASRSASSRRAGQPSGSALPPAAGGSWAALYGVSLLSGIGFTMSLFIGSLAFEDPGHAVGVRLGVFLGSILCGVCGYLVLRAAGRQTARDIAGPAKRPVTAKS